MKKTDFSTLLCPIARSLGKVGEWWSILILRDAFYGLTRFDEFEKSLQIAPNMLSRRLSDLVEAGLLEKYQYQDKPARHAYRLTEVGRDFRPVLWALLEWGNKHFAAEGEAVRVVHSETREPADMVLMDRRTGLSLHDGAYEVEAGPASGPGMQYRIGFAARRRLDPDLKFDPPVPADKRSAA